MQKKENLTFERKHTNNIHHSLWYDSQEEESRKCPERDGHVRMWDIYLLNSDSDQKKKKNEKLPFATTWMDLELIILGEGCQA